MIKAIPVSIVIASVVLPIVFATRPNPKKSLRALQITLVVLALVWALLCVFVYPQFVLVE